MTDQQVSLISSSVYFFPSLVEHLKKEKKKKKVEITYQIYIERYCDHFHMIYLIKIKFRINKVSLKDSEKEERETKKLLRR